MAWSTPMTAVANTAFTASQFNTYVRDNLLETGPAKATGGVANGSYIVKSGTNQITYRAGTQVEVLTSQTTTSTTYTNLATVGPTATVTVGTMALVSWHASISNNSDNSSYVSVQLSGANSDSASDNRALRHRDGTGSGGVEMIGMSFLFTGLSAGSTTFQLKYRTNGGTATFVNRRISVLPF